MLLVEQRPNAIASNVITFSASALSTPSPLPPPNSPRPSHQFNLQGILLEVCRLMEAETKRNSTCPEDAEKGYVEESKKYCVTHGFYALGIRRRPAREAFYVMLRFAIYRTYTSCTSFSSLELFSIIIRGAISRQTVSFVAQTEAVCAINDMRRRTLCSFAIKDNLMRISNITSRISFSVSLLFDRKKLVKKKEKKKHINIAICTCLHEIPFIRILENLPRKCMYKESKVSS